jgi:small-conductance mechanosensitive channel
LCWLNSPPSPTLKPPKIIVDPIAKIASLIRHFMYQQIRKQGQIIEIDWRATRIRTFANDMVVIPNSVIAKAIVTNHRKLNEPNISSLSLNIDASLSPASVIKALESAASASAGVAAGSKPAAYACAFAD